VDNATIASGTAAEPIGFCRYSGWSDTTLSHSPLMAPLPSRKHRDRSAAIFSAIGPIHRHCDVNAGGILDANSSSTNPDMQICRPGPFLSGMGGTGTLDVSGTCIPKRWISPSGTAAPHVNVLDGVLSRPAG